MFSPNDKPKNLFFQSKNRGSIALKKFTKINLEKALNLLIYGSLISKQYKSHKLFHKCLFYILEDDTDYLQYISQLKPYHKTRIDLKTIKNITDNPQFDSKLFKKFNDNSKLPGLLFISYGDLKANKVLILKFKTEEVKMLFWQGIQHLSHKATQKEGCFGDVRKVLAQKLFVKADKDGSKMLDFEEIKKILQVLHIEINQEFLIKFFEKYDKDKNKAIDWTEFQEIIDDISLKPELRPLFKNYCEEAKAAKDEESFNLSKMNFTEFKQFLKQEQKQELSEKEFEKLLYLINKDNTTFPIESKFSIDGDNFNLKSLNSITFSEFCSIIFSKNNEIFDPEKLEIYQDMSQPLTDYYINSSHNTYLLANQLTGESSTKAYINSFAKGCRCVELDCWEGDKGEPIIYHGYTFTSKILFRDVIQTIKDYAFVHNPYPVILSFENHCKQKQQDKLAEILLEILGEIMFVLPENYSEIEKFPSPEQLKYRVLVKDKAILQTSLKGKSMMSESLNSKTEWEWIEKKSVLEFDDEEKDSASKEKNVSMVSSFVEWSMSHRRFLNFNTEVISPTHATILRGISTDMAICSINSAKNYKKNLYELTNPMGFSVSPSFVVARKSLHISDRKSPYFSESSYGDNTEKTTRKKATSLNLKKLLVFYAIKMNLIKPRSIWNISSIKESRFEKLAKEQEDQLQDFLRRNFLRIYPSGKRVDSSNYDPIECFNFGVQMAALNVQTPDLPLLLYMAKFYENGGINCGYLLKPKFLRYEKPRYLKNFTDICKILCIEVISGQQLRPENEEDVKDVVDPYVEVSLRGTSFDEHENSKVFKSNVVMNNGFNPKFDLQCHFKLCCPEMAMVVFKVFDQELAVKDMKIGWNAVPFECIRPGFRMIPLLNSNLNQIEFSFLLCKVEIKQVVNGS